MDNEMKNYMNTVSIELLQRAKINKAPWQQDWLIGEKQIPFNPVSGKEYRGINVLYLMSKNDKDSRWVTEKQAKIMGWEIKKDAQAIELMFQKEGEIKNITLFNGSDIKGIPPLKINTAEIILYGDKISNKIEKLLDANGYNESEFYRVKKRYEEFLGVANIENHIDNKGVINIKTMGPINASDVSEIKLREYLREGFDSKEGFNTRDPKSFPYAQTKFIKNFSLYQHGVIKDKPVFTKLYLDCSKQKNRVENLSYYYEEKLFAYKEHYHKLDEFYEIRIYKKENSEENKLESAKKDFQLAMTDFFSSLKTGLPHRNIISNHGEWNKKELLMMMKNPEEIFKASQTAQNFIDKLSNGDFNQTPSKPVQLGKNIKKTISNNMGF